MFGFLQFFLANINRSVVKRATDLLRPMLYYTILFMYFERFFVDDTEL